jgi:hypothetical protein
VGWHYDAGVEFLRMVVAGVFDRFPRLQIVIGHGQDPDHGLRYRRTLVQERTREKQRAEKLLEDAQLTELRERIAVSGGLASGRAVRFPARDQRRGWRAGSVVAEGAALRSA